MRAESVMYRLSTSESDEATRPFARDKTGGFEILVLRPVALDEEVAVLPRVVERVEVEVEHDVPGACLPELLGDATAHSTVAADDVVVRELLDRPPPPSLGQCASEDSVSDPLDKDRRDEGKDSQSG